MEFIKEFASILILVTIGASVVTNGAINWFYIVLISFLIIFAYNYGKGESKQ